MTLARPDDDGAIQPIMRTFRDSEIRRTAEVARDRRIGGRSGRIGGGPRTVHIPEIANVDVRTVVRLEDIVSVEFDDTVGAHDGPIRTAVVEDLAIEPRPRHRPALDGSVGRLLAAGHGVEYQPLMEIDADVEDILEVKLEFGHTIALRAGSGAKAWPRIRSAAFSAIMMTAALVLPPGTVGITEASTTRKPAMPRTRSFGSSTASDPAPIAQVPTGCCVTPAWARM